MNNQGQCCGHSQSYHVNGVGECTYETNIVNSKCPCKEFEPREIYKKGFVEGKAEMYETLRDVVMKQRKEQYDLGYLHGIEAENERWLNQPANEHDNKLKVKIKADLLKIADEGEYEDLRREVKNYFK